MPLLLPLLMLLGLSRHHLGCYIIAKGGLLCLPSLQAGGEEQDAEMADAEAGAAPEPSDAENQDANRPQKEGACLAGLRLPLC